MREKSIIRLIVGGVLAIATLLLVIWFFNNFEMATREIRTGFSREAQRNPFLAAEHFLNRLGVTTTNISISELWQQLPEDGDVIIFHRYSPPRGDKRKYQLREWIKSGGHLIIDAGQLPTHKTDKGKPVFLLSELGVQVEEREFDPSKESEERIDIDFAALDKPVAVTMSNMRYLLDKKNLSSAGAPFTEGYALLQYEMGNGRITVLADNDFLGNRHIGQDDHALALALLVGTSYDGKVWLVHDVLMPSLPSMIWEYAAEGVIAAAVAVLLWLWSLGTRLGPRLPPLSSPRRDIGEHLAATAHYLWRLDRGKALLHSNRQRIEQDWISKHYVLRAMTQQERCEWIASRSGLSPEVVARTLYDDHAAESDFIERSAHLQVLRATL